MRSAHSGARPSAARSSTVCGRGGAQAARAVVARRVAFESFMTQDAARLQPCPSVLPPCCASAPAEWLSPCRQARELHTSQQAPGGAPSPADPAPKGSPARACATAGASRAAGCRRRAPQTGTTCGPGPVAWGVSGVRRRAEQRRGPCRSCTWPVQAGSPSASWQPSSHVGCFCGMHPSAEQLSASGGQTRFQQQGWAPTLLTSCSCHSSILAPCCQTTARSAARRRSAPSTHPGSATAAHPVGQGVPWGCRHRCSGQADPAAEQAIQLRRMLVAHLDSAAQIC